MPDSSNSHQTAVSSEIMSNKESKADSDKKGPDRVHIDLGEVTQHNIKVLKKVNQVNIVKAVWKECKITQTKWHYNFDY